MMLDHKGYDDNNEKDEQLASLRKAETNRDLVGPITVPVKKPDIKLTLSFKRVPTPDFLTKEQDCCNRATS